MVTEKIILAIVAALYCRTCTNKLTLNGSGPGEPSKPHISESLYEHSLSKQALYDEMLQFFDVSEIENAILWMKLRGYLAAFGWGIVAPEMGYHLTEKGIKYAESKVMPEEDIERLSGKVISVKPSWHGFTLDPEELW
jgi:hypothetical protein